MDGQPTYLSYIFRLHPLLKIWMCPSIIEPYQLNENVHLLFSKYIMSNHYNPTSPHLVVTSHGSNTFSIRECLRSQTHNKCLLHIRCYNKKFRWSNYSHWLVRFPYSPRQLIGSVSLCPSHTVTNKPATHWYGTVGSVSLCPVTLWQLTISQWLISSILV